MIRPAQTPAPGGGASGPAASPVPAPGAAVWAIVILTLFLLARTPVLFARQRLIDVFGGPIAPIWQDDALVRSALLLPSLAVCALLMRNLETPRSLRHAILLSLLALAVVSTEWSVEPSVTQIRALAFIATAGVGWYLGSRFTLRQQLDVVIAAGTIGVTLSLAALVAWPDEARQTNGVAGEWSGVYVNRNLLALVICTTILATILRWPTARWSHRGGLVALTIGGAWLLQHSGARTGPVALAGALGVVALGALIRTVLVRRGASATVATAALAGATSSGVLIVRAANGQLLELLGRESTLTRRTEMWEIDRALLEVRPWRGWGFEATWAHPPVVDFAAPLFRAYPYQAHNGYFEMALSLGRLGLFLLLGLIVLTVVRCVALAWDHSGPEALWPLGIATFAIVANLSESLFIANEALWALFVAAGIASVTWRSAPGDGQALAGLRRISR